MTEDAREIWRRKLAFLEAEEAKISDPSQRFTVAEQIREAKAKLADLDGKGDELGRIRRAAGAVAQNWAAKTKGHPLIDLAATRVERSGKDPSDIFSLEQIEQSLSQSGRIVLEGPAGWGKTTTLIQLAQRARTVGIAFIVELTLWTSSGRTILEYIAGIPAFQAEGLTSFDLARVQQTAPFLFLLNGWNEIVESSSNQAVNALRELERDFPSAGIVVATRTHHLTPPLPGALRLRLLSLRRSQRDAYLEARLGPTCAELRSRIDADPSLEALTRTPFILAEVVSLFAAGAEIPSTRIGVLDQVCRLQEQRDEHRNALQEAPIFGCQADYLTALATEMTRRGAVALAEADARSLSAAIARKLADQGQIDRVAPPAVLAALTAHHVLERLDYPQTAFQFAHHQLQEYYVALGLRARLFDIPGDVQDGIRAFTAEYVNAPAWAEPLRMVAEALAGQTDDEVSNTRNAQAGAKLVEMALVVDLVFAGELAHLCGENVWNEVRVTVGERLRDVYASGDDSYRKYALAAMLATGKDDFNDIIVPLLSGKDQQARLTTYRLWPDLHVSSIGAHWRDQVRRWDDDARVDFVSELLFQHIDDEIADFAVGDDNGAVKEAAASGLMWFGADDLLIGVLDSMDAKTFEEFAIKYARELPAALKPRVVGVMRNFIDGTEKVTARLAATLALIDLGETGFQAIVRDATTALSSAELRNLSSSDIRSVLEYLFRADPAWASEWVLVQIAAGVIDAREYLLPFAAAIPDGPVQEYLSRLGADVRVSAGVECKSAARNARADVWLAAGIFSRLRELRRTGMPQRDAWNQSEQEETMQLEEIFRRLPDDAAATGILSCVKIGNSVDIIVAADLLSRVARQHDEPLRLPDDILRARLRAYLKGSIDLVLTHDDFTGEEKANLASAIAQVGEAEDMKDLVKLIRADIDRMRRGQDARAAGDHGPLGNGGRFSYSRWHIAAVLHLDPAGADQVLIDLLSESEYLADVIAEMAREFSRTLRYDAIWSARGGGAPTLGDDQRRQRFAAALRDTIERRRQGSRDGKPPTGLKQLARALAAIDGRDSAQVVLDVIATPGQWDESISLESANSLLMAGVVFPAATAFAVVDSILERSARWLEDSDKQLVLRILALWPFFDDPVGGLARLRDMLGRWKLSGASLCGVITPLGESRSEAAIDLLCELAVDARTCEQCENEILNALAALDTPRARELLLGYVDPDIRGSRLAHRHHRGQVLVARLADLARRRREVAVRLEELCERDLPESSRHVLSKVMSVLGTPEALYASLNLIDDTKATPVPEGTRDQLNSAFLERRPHDQYPGAFTEHGRASNEVRSRLFRMANEDQKRRKSAFALLGQVEQWRLEHGRPTGEPRHPDLESGKSWPPTA